MFWYFTVEQEMKETYKWQLSTGKWKDWTLKLFAGKETQDKNKLHYLVGIYRSPTSTVRGCFFLLLHVFSHESYDTIPLSKALIAEPQNFCRQYICKWLFGIYYCQEVTDKQLEGLIIKCKRQYNYYTMNQQVLVRGELSMWQLQD